MGKDQKKARFDKAVDIIKDAVFGEEEFQGNIVIPIKNREIGKVKVERWIDPAPSPKPRLLTEDK